MRKDYGLKFALQVAERPVIRWHENLKKRELHDWTSVTGTEVINRDPHL